MKNGLGIMAFGMNENTANELEKSVLKGHSVNVVGFENETAAQEFINLFPKYVKLNTGTITTSDGGFKERGIMEIAPNKAIYVDFKIMQRNSVTGDLNETGIKRLKKFVEILKKENLIN